MNKNTEQKLTSLITVAMRFPDDKACRIYLERIRWNGKLACVHCGSEKKIYRFNNGKLFKCADCKKQFTVKVGTIFEDSQVPLQKWFFAMYLITAHKKGISSLQLSRDIQVTQKTAWFMLHRIRYSIKNKSFLKPLKNVVEVDETYIGGKKHRGKRGRGSENKTAVFGMVERNGDVRSMPVQRVNGKTLKAIIRNNVSKKAVVMSDEWGAYRGLDKEYEAHKVINHGKKEYVRGGTFM